jgi:hypothetical protein
MECFEERSNTRSSGKGDDDDYKEADKAEEESMWPAEREVVSCHALDAF